MAAPLETTKFKEALIILGAAAVVVPIFYRLRLSPVLGFLLVGMAVGPFGLGTLADRLPWLDYVTIDDPETIAPVAELGVVLLLFVIGLELSFNRLRLMRRMVFGLGPLKVALSALAITAIVYALGEPLLGSVVLGLALAMSSTAIITQLLAEERVLSSPLGRSSFAVLLFEDLAVVPILFGVTMLGVDPGGSPAGAFGLALAKAGLAIAALIIVGRQVLRPLFRQVARTKSPELFMAACLLVVIGTSLVTAAAGLSMAIGALLAGLLLAETEFRRQIEATIEPFKGLLLGVFLISVGMSVDLSRVADDPFQVLGALVALVLVKGMIVTLLARLFGLPWSTGLHSGLILGPASEFTVVILGLGLGLGIIRPPAGEFVLLVTALSMATIPLLFRLGARLAPRVAPPETVDPSLLVPVVDHATPRVIVAGFGRVGQTIAALLEAHRVPYVAVDNDVDRVSRERNAGRPVYYGDMTRPELLQRLDLDSARALVVTIDSRPVADALVTTARAERPDLLIVARARDANHAAHLYNIGATDAVPETIEASLQLGESLLVDIGVPMGPVIASVHEKRADFQAQIKALAPEAQVRESGRRRLRDVQPATAKPAEQHS